VRDAFAQPETAKSVLSVLDSGVAPKVTEPPVAVRVTLVQVELPPTTVLGQVELPEAVT